MTHKHIYTHIFKRSSLCQDRNDFCVLEVWGNLGSMCVRDSSKIQLLKKLGHTFLQNRIEPFGEVAKSFIDVFDHI